MQFTSTYIKQEVREVTIFCHVAHTISDSGTNTDTKKEFDGTVKLLFIVIYRIWIRGISVARI